MILMTEEEYLAREREAEFRSEFYKGEMLEMARSSSKHTRVKDNLARHLGNALDNSSCVVMTSDMRVKILATGLLTYPDILVVCGEPLLVDDDELDTLLNPQIVIEILSPSTERYDRGKKFGHYRTVETLLEYWLVAQDRPSADRYVREADGGWKLTAFEDLAGDLEFPSIGVRIPMAKVYAGVEFEEDSIG